MGDKTTTTDSVELTRRVLACADASDIHSVMDFVAEDSVWDVSSWAFGTYEGPKAIRRFLEDWIGSFVEYRRETREIVDLGDGIVYAETLTRGRPSFRQQEIHLRGGTVCVWTGGMLRRVTFYREPDQGREAAQRLADSRR